MDYLEGQIRSLVYDQIAPGVSYAVIDHGNIRQGCLGDNSWYPTTTSLHPNMLYDLASLTKVIGTTTVLLHLIETGKLSFSTKICEYFPGFDSKVTIAHLMTHSSGIKGYIPNRDKLNASELEDAILHLPITSDFEKIIKYTDSGPIIMGMIIEKIYHEPVQQVITEQILQPLGLTTATFNPDPKNCVVTNKRDGKWLYGQVHDPKAYQLGKHCGSAGMFAEIDDLIKFAQFMLGQLKLKQVPIHAATIDKLFHNFTKINPGRSFGWDLRKNKNNQYAIFHTGFTGNLLAVDRKRQRAMIYLSNRVHPFNDNKKYLDYKDAILDAFLME